MLRLLICCGLFLATTLAAQAQKAPDTPKGSKTVVDPDKVIIKKQRTEHDRLIDSLYHARVQMERIEGIYIPRDLYDAFAQLDQLMDEDARKTFMAFSDEEVDARTHGTLGVWIEHKWSMSEGSRLSEYFRQMKVPHYDYMIGIIIRSYHRHLHDRDLGIKEQVLFFRDHWKKKQKNKADELIFRSQDGK